MADTQTVKMILGDVTAYGFAKSAGYTGTAEQFANDQAHFAENAAEVRKLVEEVVDNMPKIGPNGNWWQWDAATHQYVDTGIDASITINFADVTMLDPDAEPYVTNTGTSTDSIIHFFIPRGKGISKIEKTGTSGIVDTYTITFSDGQTYTYTITNGKDGIDGKDGEDGTDGVDGKSAYESAVEGGYDRTEEQFNEELANFKDLSDSAIEAADDARAYADNIGGHIIYRGSITFAEIPTTGLSAGVEYNIVDEFTTDNRFEVGSGVSVAEGAFIVYTVDDKWSIPVMQAGDVDIIANDVTETMIINSNNVTVDDETETIIFG